MEKINKEVNESHRQLFANMSKIYSDLSKNMTQSYLTGKKEAYEEVLNWLINSTHNESKYISPISFYNMITEKNVKSKIALASKNEDDDISHNECKKKLHRMYISNNTESNNSSSDNSFVPVSITNLLNSDSNGYSSDEMMNGNNSSNTNSNTFFGCNSGLKRKK